MMHAEWIRTPRGGTSVVFVHGILSSGEACWRHENGSYWPELLKNEPELESTSIYVFTYHTGIFSGSYRLGDIVDALKEHMRLDGVLESDRLVFVCHSMGGLVVRKFIVERAAELIEAEKDIGLFLVASPSLGSSYADWLTPLAQLLGHAQADALRFVRDNYWLQDLDKEFINLKEADKLKIKGKELVEDKFVTLRGLLRRQVVEPFSGARYFGEPFKVPGSDHFSIAKPEDSRAIQHRLLCQFIKETLEVKGQPNVFEIESYETTVAVRPVSPQPPLAVKYERPNREPKIREVETDNVATLERTIRFSPMNRCTSLFGIHYHTEGNGFVKYIDDKVNHRNEASAEDRGAYDVGGKILIYKFTPKPDEVYELGFEIYDGFAVGHRNIHFHFTPDKHYHYFKYTLDLRPYLEQGYEVTREPAFYLYPDARDTCDSCGDINSGEPVKRIEAAKGLWSWELRHIRQGAMTLVWDVAPSGEKVSGK